MVQDTDTVTFYHVKGIGKNFVSYFQVCDGEVNKVFVMERGDTLVQYDYSPSVSSITFDLRMERIKSDINAFETIDLKPLPSVGDTRLASEFIEIPQSKTSKHQPFNADAICNASILTIAIFAYSAFLIQTRGVWAEFFGKVANVVRS
jgi:hypothetical protein